MSGVTSVTETQARAIALYRSGRFADAAEVLASIPPDHAATMSLLGLCRPATRLKLYAGLDLLARAAAVGPQRWRNGMNFGMGLMASGDTAQAASLFRVAAGLLPLDPAPHLNLAGALLALGELPPPVPPCARQSCGAEPGAGALHRRPDRYGDERPDGGRSRLRPRDGTVAGVC